MAMMMALIFRTYLFSDNGLKTSRIVLVEKRARF